MITLRKFVSWAIVGLALGFLAEAGKDFYLFINQSNLHVKILDLLINFSFKEFLYLFIFSSFPMFIWIIFVNILFWKRKIKNKEVKFFETTNKLMLSGSVVNFGIVSTVSYFSGFEHMVKWIEANWFLASFTLLLLSLQALVEIVRLLGANSSIDRT